MTAHDSDDALKPSISQAQSPHPPGDYPGHTVWIDGHWKLHRITRAQGHVTWELYDLAADPAEKHNLATSETAPLPTLQAVLETWLQSVVRSYNGEHYPKAPHAP